MRPHILPRLPMPVFPTVMAGAVFGLGQTTTAPAPPTWSQPARVVAVGLPGMAGVRQVGRFHLGGAAPRVMGGERLYAQAAKQFRKGRFPEAYGRFVAPADAGHAPSARLVLLMYEQGPTLFDSDWDCAPHQVQDWADAAGVAAPAAVNRIYGAAAAVRATTPSHGARR